MTGSLRVYFSQLGDYFLANSITDDGEKVAGFKLGLSSGDCRRFVLQTELPSAFSDVEKTLTKIYEPQSPEVAKSRLLDACQVPAETCAEFAERVKFYIRDAYPGMSSSAQAQLGLDLFRRGLRPNLRQQLPLTDASDFNTLLAFLRRLEAKKDKPAYFLFQKW